MSQPVRRKPRQILGMNNSSQVEIRLNNTNKNYIINNNNNTSPAVTTVSSVSPTPQSISFALNNQQHHHRNINNDTNNYNNQLSSKNLHNNPTTVMNTNIDRLRLQAEMASYWPYGQFISPICAPPGYGLLSPTGAAAMPYAMPVYQPTGGIPNSYENCQMRSGQGGGNTNNNNNTRNNNEPNNMLIQIGLQCVNQNNPVNINSLNDLSVPITKITTNDQDISVIQTNIAGDFSSSPTNSTNSFSEKDFEKKFSTRFNVDIPDGSSNTTNQQLNTKSITPPVKEDTVVVLSQKQFVELTRLAMRGSETAERLAYTHRNRPCFKKIDSLCARMKQDLIRPDGVLPNINSQGIAWAVKDFIFVFTRVINAWIIIKGYVYNTPEGLNKVKAALSTDFIRSFAAWQDTTMDFVENLIKSFVNLDQLVQSQKTPFQKMENMMKNTSSTPMKNHQANNNNNNNNNYDTNSIFDDSFDFLNISNDQNYTKLNTNCGNEQVGSIGGGGGVGGINIIGGGGCNNINGNGTGINSTITGVGGNNNICPVPISGKSYYSTLVEDSEESQRKATANGTYFKTGVYNPILKDSISEMDPLYFSAKKEIVDPILEPPAPQLDKTIISKNLQQQQQQNPAIVTTPVPAINDISSWQSNSNVFTTPTTLDDDEQQQQQSLGFYHSPVHGEGDGKLLNSKSLSLENLQKTSTNCLPYHLKILEKNITKFSNTFDPTVTRPIGTEMVKKLEILLEKIRNLSEGNMFFSERFMKNYFPDFALKYPKFLDLRSIFLKAQTGGYGNINEIVHDLKLIIYYARVYLKTNQNDLLKNSIDKYEIEINKILKDKIFNNFQFEFITGDPNKF